MRKFYINFYLIIFLHQIILAQDSTKTNFSFSQNENVFSSPAASFTESRIGLIKDFQTSKIRLDIGASPDIMEFSFDEGKFFEKAALGADFHAFGLLFNESEKIILQVDAIDAFFGGHISFKNFMNFQKLSARLRIMHLSSHLVDGHYDTYNNTWRDGKNPVPFGREFVELSMSYPVNNFSLFLGMNYIFRQRPEVLSKTNFDFAIDFRSAKFANNMINFYIGYDFKINGIQGKYSGSNSLETGLDFGSKRGIKLFLLYYSGKNYYGEYYSENLRYPGAGFNITP